MNEVLDLFLVDFGVAASLNGGAAFRVIFSQKYDPIAELGADGRTITALGKTSDLGGALQGDTLSVDGTDWIISSVEPVQDGKFTVARLMNG